MSFKDKLLEHKAEFCKIFDKTFEHPLYKDKDNINYDGLIQSHLNSWITSRIKGASASMAYYDEEIDAIKLIDKLAKEYFKYDFIF